MKIFAVVVTYNRLPLLKEVLEHLLMQSRKLDYIYLIDNASDDGTEEYCQKVSMQYEGTIKHYRMSSNVGGAGGFAEGIKLAYEDGADYIWGMDDDAVPELNALEILVNATAIFPPSEFCLRSNTYHIDSNGNYVLEQVTESNQRNMGLTFVGFFIPKELVAKIGYPRDDLFIYYDEVDYSMSIIENGYEIVGIRESIIKHPYIMPNKTRKFLWHKVIIPDMPKWKMYYWMRNDLLIRRQKKRHFWREFILELYILTKLLIFKTDYFAIACIGFWHGIIGKSGHRKNTP